MALGRRPFRISVGHNGNIKGTNYALNRWNFCWKEKTEIVEMLLLMDQSPVTWGAGGDEDDDETCDFLSPGQASHVKKDKCLLVDHSKLD